MPHHISDHLFDIDFYVDRYTRHDRLASYRAQHSAFTRLYLRAKRLLSAKISFSY
jgi:hypothetical protein